MATVRRPCPADGHAAVTPPRLHWTQETARSGPPTRVTPQTPGRSFTGTDNLRAVTTSKTGRSHDRSPRPRAAVVLAYRVGLVA